MDMSGRCLVRHGRDLMEWRLLRSGRLLGLVLSLLLATLNAQQTAPAAPAAPAPKGGDAGDKKPAPGPDEELEPGAPGASETPPGGKEGAPAPRKGDEPVVEPPPPAAPPPPGLVPINRFPQFKYYPFSPVPGWSGFTEPYIKMPPEYQAYEGGLVHYRHQYMKYLPALPIYNQNSLTRNFVFKDLLPAGELTDYAERIYRYKFPNDRGWETRGDTGQFRPPVKTLKLKPGDAFPELKLGRLPLGLYNLRVIAAIRLEDDSYPPPEMFFELKVNDGRAGATSTYLLRGRTMCNFYSACDFFFHVTDDREFVAHLTYTADSEPALFVYNVDLHNALAESMFAAVKTRTTLRTEPAVTAGIEKILKDEAGAKPPAAEQVRAAWEQVPPLNSMFAIFGITWAPSDPKLAAQENRVNLRAIMWSYAPLEGQFHLGRSEKAAKLDGVGPKPDRPAGEEPLTENAGEKKPKAEGEGEEELTLDEPPKLVVDYTRAELAQHKVLKGTKDRGLGERVKAEGGAVRYNADLPFAVGQALGAAPVNVDQVRELATKYYGPADNGLFLASVRFAALVYALPSLVHSHHLPHQVNIWRPDRLPEHMTYTVLPFAPTALCETYDLLFPYLAQSQRLAAALHEHIPWVKTPQDVVKLFDTFLVQYTARLHMYYRIHWGHDSAQQCILVATVMNNAEASAPLLEWLSHNNHIYPQALCGFMDSFSIGATRDGGTTIGSFFYGMSPDLEFVALMRQYVAAGGMKQYDLSDRRRYPKAWASLSFPMVARVAGYYAPGIGDVGGPIVEYYHWLDTVIEAARISYQITGDPQYAAMLVKHADGRPGLVEDWDATRAKAKGVRDPMLGRRSRVLADWEAVLESGSEYDDPRAKAALSVRLGTGAGHNHADTLDLRLWGHGVTMSGDAGQRPDYGRPTHTMSRLHNVVEINERNLASHSWARELADFPGAPYLHVAAAAPGTRAFTRQLALVKITPGTIPPGPAQLARNPDVVTPEHYVVDIQRVDGGTVHTYCFHGASDDQLTVNLPKRERPPEGPLRNYLGDFYYDQRYYTLLKLFFEGKEMPKELGDSLGPDDLKGLELEDPATAKRPPAMYEPWTAVCAQPVLEADWRQAKNEDNQMLGPVAAPTPPRKYVRLSLFEQQGATILHGLGINDPYIHIGNPLVPYYAVRNLYARREAKAGEQLTTAFIALIEPYAGEPQVVEKRLVEVRDNEADAQRAVALALKMKNGREDLIFADGWPEKTRTLASGETATAEYALLARDADGICQLSVCGRQFKARDCELRLLQSEYRAKVVRVDYAQLQVHVDQRWPGKLLTGEYLQVGNDQHHTGFTVESVAEAEGHSVLQFGESIEIFRSRVMFVYQNQVRLATSRFLPFGKGDGLTATDEKYTTEWHCEVVPGGDRWQGFTFRLSGPPVTAESFPPGSGLVVHEFGPGDEFSVRCYAGLQRRAPGQYAVLANADFVLRLAGASFSVSLDGQQWTPITAAKEDGLLTATISPGTIGAREFLLRVQ